MSTRHDEILGTERLEAVRRLGYREVPEMLEELAPAVADGESVAALAGEGSGKELVYALAAVENADPESPGVQALVLTATPEAAARTARALHQLGAPAGLDALAWLPWRAEAEDRKRRPFAQLLAGRPAELLPEVRAGRLKLSDLRLLVIDGISALEAAGQWEAVAALLDTLPAEAASIVVDIDRTKRFDEVLTHRMTRARKWPRKLFVDRGDETGAIAEDAPVLHYGTGADEEGRMERLADALREASEETGVDRAFVHCPDEATAHRVAASLASRGLELTDRTDEPGVVVAWGDDEEPPTGVGALVGLPGSPRQLRRWLGDATARAVIVPPEEVTQLRLVARRAGWRLQEVAESPPAEARDVLERYRGRVRQRLESRDDAAELLVLEPLLREYGSARLAAALSGLLREGPAAPETRGTGEAEGERASERPGPAGRRAERGRGRGPGAGWTRLYVSAGRKDDVGPNDLVGAITGETDAVGGQIGEIDVRATYSLVDVDAEIAEQVMDRLTGVKIKGREVLVRRDRES